MFEMDLTLPYHSPTPPLTSMARLHQSDGKSIFLIPSLALHTKSQVRVDVVMVVTTSAKCTFPRYPGNQQGYLTMTGINKFLTSLRH
jgi:hypothetical protein